LHQGVDALANAINAKVSEGADAASGLLPGFKVLKLGQPKAGKGPMGDADGDRRGTADRKNSGI